jgi:hypothetical protein
VKKRSSTKEKEKKVKTTSSTKPKVKKEKSSKSKSDKPKVKAAPKAKASPKPKVEKENLDIKVLQDVHNKFMKQRLELGKLELKIEEYKNQHVALMKLMAKCHEDLKYERSR